jgi:hypothetical protein
MYAYLSGLVELKHFDSIFINFLIVGHTHGADDQLFSVLGRKIHWARFIGSPMSLDALLKIAHARPEDRPHLVKRIKVIYDIKTALDPYINKGVHNYQYPHCARITLVHNKAVFQYKLFSTFDEWLPKMPSSTSLAEAQICVPEHSSVGGEAEFLRHVGLQDVTLASATPDQRNLMNNLEAMRSQLRDLDAHSTTQMLARLEAQAEGLEAIDRELLTKAETESRLMRSSKQNEGMMLNLSVFSYDSNDHQ